MRAFGKKANRGGTDGPMKGRSVTLASISTNEGMENAIPTQGQAEQFGAESPASAGRIRALKKFRRAK